MRPSRSAVRLLLAAGLLAGVAFVSRADEPEARGTTHALLINGGSQAKSNYQSHLHHLQDMVRILERRGLPRERIHVFSADGEDPAADLAVRDTRPSGFWLIEGTRVGRKLRPRTELTDTSWPGITLRPARKKVLREWFESAGQFLSPADRLLIFVTDHGTVNRDDLDNGAISLWNEDLSVREFQKLLGNLPPGVRKVMVMSQCYSGTFANAMNDAGASEPSGQVCGFFSAARDLRAYGCYPEGRDRDRIGHAFRFIDALARRADTADAHLEVLLTDGTPDTPLRTRDVYVERVLSDEANGRGSSLDTLVDELLAEAWWDRATWEPEIRLLDRIGDAFGTFSPRTLAELHAYEAELSGMTERMKTYAERWKATLVDVREENLRSFVEERPEWRDRLRDGSLDSLDADGRMSLLSQLLPTLEADSRNRPELWRRLEDLHERAQLASEARWRLDTRRAALLRLRSILVGIAARVFLDAETATEDETRRRAAQRRALEGLERCESFEPGVLPDRDRVAHAPRLDPFPSLEDDLRLMEEVLPSWLGVRFKVVPKSLRAGRRLPDGAAFLNAVYPDSPALEAGLEVGDIVLGPPGRPFTDVRQIREWTMTSPRDTALLLRALRPGDTVEEDREFDAVLFLRPYPTEWPDLPTPPQVGEAVQPLPAGLEPVGRAKLPDLRGRPHVLFFWATWCKPCKRAVPEVLAFAKAERYTVLAISDEDADTVAGYLKTSQEPFFERVATDPRRKSFISLGVSGTPTIILVDEEGVIRHRQVGYRESEGLTVEGWTWAEP